LKYSGVLYATATLTIFGKEIETDVKKVMPVKYPAAICIAAIILIVGCRKGHYPLNASNAKKTTVAPQVIIVNDSAAKKSVDGRLYYDVGGHRYWRNYDDGKYYLFNKSMFTNKAFKPH
jgi:hypothetical protein